MNTSESACRSTTPSKIAFALSAALLTTSLVEGPPISLLQPCRRGNVEGCCRYDNVLAKRSGFLDFSEIVGIRAAASPHAKGAGKGTHIGGGGCVVRQTGVAALATLWFGAGEVCVAPVGNGEGQRVSRWHMCRVVTPIPAHYPPGVTLRSGDNVILACAMESESRANICRT